MSRRSISARSAIVSAAAAAMIVLSASPALANTISRGGFSCGPDMQVVLSYNLSPAATSSWHFVTSSGTVSGPAPKVNNVTLNTGVRSVSSWGASSSATITFAGASCA